MNVPLVHTQHISLQKMKAARDKKRGGLKGCFMKFLFFLDLYSCFVSLSEFFCFVLFCFFLGGGGVCSW